MTNVTAYKRWNTVDLFLIPIQLSLLLNQKYRNNYCIKYLIIKCFLQVLFFDWANHN